jgi:4-amino-4-deoxy-L-arabinose transferase-like glycosyltransferase
MRLERLHPALVFAAIFATIFLLHLPVLQLPYFWDEAGYYVPAARDILVSGSFVPRTTISNAHPPLVLTWLALWWKEFGFAPPVTRSAMLLAAALSLCGVYRLAESVANSSIAVAATACTALYPVFFAQSSLAQVDLPAAGFIFWGMSAYFEERPLACAIWFSLGVLSKETAVLAPLAIAGWEILLRAWVPNRANGSSRRLPLMASLLFPILPLALWYSYHYLRTGYVFGNAEFFRYNVAGTLNLTRFGLALLMRLWQIFGYLHLWLLTGAMLLAMAVLPAVREQGRERPRIEIPVQLVFTAVIATYAVAMAIIGGAVLARYMLPAVPLVIILAVSTLGRRVPLWWLAVAVIAIAFVAGWFSNPPYGFSPEDNLAYRDYILLHQGGERFLEARYPMARVLTAWPASDEVTRPWLGYITRPMRVVRIENFSADEILSAGELRDHFDVGLVFSTKYEPGSSPWDRWQKWTELKSRFFGFHRDLPPRAVAQILAGQVVFEEERKGQWIAVIELNKVAMPQEASNKAHANF